MPKTISEIVIENFRANNEIHNIEDEIAVMFSYSAVVDEITLALTTQQTQIREMVSHLDYEIRNQMGNSLKLEKRYLEGHDDALVWVLRKTENIIKDLN